MLGELFGTATTVSWPNASWESVRLTSNRGSRTGLIGALLDYQKKNMLTGPGAKAQSVRYSFESRIAKWRPLGKDLMIVQTIRPSGLHGQLALP